MRDVLSPLCFSSLWHNGKSFSRKCKAIKGVQGSPSFSSFVYLPSPFCWWYSNLLWCSKRDTEKISQGLNLFQRATGMQVNERKYSISTTIIDPQGLRHLSSIFLFQTRGLEEGLKYLGFQLKPNEYRKRDMYLMLSKLEKQLKVWGHRGSREQAY